MMITCWYAAIAEETPTGDEDPKEKTEVIDVHGKRYLGRLRRLTAAGVELETPQHVTLAIDDVLRLVGARHSKRPPPHSSMVFLANGDRLAVRPTAMDEENLNGTWLSFPDRPAVSIPLETVRGIVVDVPGFSKARRRVVRNLLAVRHSTDVVILKNADRVSGTLADVSSKSLTLETATGQSTIPREGILAVAFSSDLISFPNARGRRAIVSLVDGSRITAAELDLDTSGILSMRGLFGAKLQFPFDAVESIVFLGGRAVFVSDLDPIDYEFRPYLSQKHALVRDYNVRGGPLVLRGIEYAKGLGMHSRSAVTYQLDREFHSFLSMAGIDDGARRQGSVEFAVEVDGKRVYSSALQQGGEPAVRVGPIDLRGKQTLTLVVEFGQRGDIGDFADWCDAVIVREPAEE